MWDLIVSVPDHGLSFYLGAVLLQDENGMQMSVSYANKKLKQSENEYSVIEKECLATVSLSRNSHVIDMENNLYWRRAMHCWSI